MDNWTQRIFLSLTLLSGFATSPLASAEQEGPVQVIEPELERREITINDIDYENFEIGLYYGVISIEDFRSNNVVGLRMAYHITEDIFIEGTYSQAEGDKTSYERLNGGLPLFSNEDREFINYGLVLGWNIFPGEVFIGKNYAFNSAFYLVGGAGNTDFLGKSWFTYTIGGGYRALFTDWLAWHIDVRDHLFDRDTFGDEELTNNIEFHTGFTVFF